MVQKGFFQATLEKLIKEWTGVFYLVMNITPIVPSDIPLMYIGCRYNYCNILGFIATGRA